MKKVDSRTGLELIDRKACFELLAHGEVGRLAVVSGGAPEIFPVNYVFDGTAIVLRTDAGTKLTASDRSRACFEIDDFDAKSKQGWSVIVHGRLEELDEHAGPAYERACDLGVEPWAGPKDHLLRLVPARVTGRRVSARS